MLEWITAATASSSEETDNIFILSICEVISNCSAKNGQSIDGVMIEVLFTTVKQGLYLILHFKMLNAFFLGKALDKHI